MPLCCGGINGIKFVEVDERGTFSCVKHVSVGFGKRAKLRRCVGGDVLEGHKTSFFVKEELKKQQQKVPFLNCQIAVGIDHKLMLACFRNDYTLGGVRPGNPGCSELC